MGQLVQLNIPMVHKICNRCKISKPIDQFNKETSNKKGGLARRCKKCVSGAVAQYRKDNLGYVKKLEVASAKRRRKTVGYKTSQRRYKIKSLTYVQGVIADWKAKGCQVCGHVAPDKPWRFDAHHTDPGQKEYLISRMSSIIKIKSELEKCIVVCSNCHRDIHHSEVGKSLVGGY
jgi:hypothetical protein